MRPLLRIIFGFALLTATAAASEVVIVRTLAGWRDAASFRRVSEYFTGKENTSGILVLRTQPDQRAGFYFLVRLKNDGAPAAAKVDLQVITPTDAKPKSFAFETTVPAGKSVFNFGLTGSDWTDAQMNPVAWKIDFLAADGRVIATQQSYLWDHPGGE